MQFPRLLPATSLLLVPTALLAQSAPVPKTNPMKVYVHMMPWFQTPETLGGTTYGWHWTMNNQNPNLINSSGEQEIASNYYPLTGPYDSTDSNIIEYQMLLIKLSGIDGVIVDWYGQKGSNSDINSLLTASNTIVNSTATYGLQFAACLEDRFASSTSDVSTNINYLRQNYFTKSNYIRTGTSNSPLMPIFGPVTYTKASQWNTIMAASPGEKIDALPLWYQSQQLGTNAGGEFSWIYEDAGTNDHLTQQQNFLTIQSPSLKKANSNATVMGVAYPGFNDFYQQGGTTTVIPFNPIPSNNGQTLASVLSVDATDSSDMNMLQLATWNDYGEGTMFEPTVQTGFSYLEQVQKFTGVSYGLSQLELVYQLYEERTANAGSSAVQTVLNQASSDLNQLDFTDAATALNLYQNVTWSGSAGNNHWSTASNWSANKVVATNVLVFAGTSNLTTTNDFPVQTQFNGFTFAAGAGAFTLAGNSVNLYGDIVNNSANLQTVNLPLILQVPVNINAASGDITIAGNITDGVNGPTGLTKLGTHATSLSGTNSYSGPTAVSNGILAITSTGSLASTSVSVAGGATLNVSGILSTSTNLSVAGNVAFSANSGTGILTQTLASISLSNGGTVAIAPPTASANRTVLAVNALTFSGSLDGWQGTLDLGANDLIIHNGNITNIANQIQSGANFNHGGYWNGSAGILSTSTAADPTFLTAIGYSTGGSSFDGVNTSTSDVLVKYTYYGDANLDGTVNGADYQQIDNGFGLHLTGWQNGDFNYDGVVDGSDYSLIDNTFNQLNATDASPLVFDASFSAQTPSPVFGISSVPEPANLATLAIGALGVFRRRRQHHANKDR